MLKYGYRKEDPETIICFYPESHPSGDLIIQDEYMYTISEDTIDETKLPDMSKHEPKDKTRAYQELPLKIDKQKKITVDGNHFKKKP